MYRISLVFLILLFVISESEAQRRGGEGSIGIGPQIGYHRASDADEGRFLYGGFLRAKLSNSFGVEGSVNYRSEVYGNGLVTVRSWPVLVSALFYPFPMFYGVAGGGWYNCTFDFDEGLSVPGDLNDETKSAFGWHIGAGTEIPLAESVMLTGDVKYVFLDYDWDELNDVPLADFNSNFFLISVGIAFGLR